ncbi:MAG: DUF898 family protein [Polyangia bacterium]|jgi:uncharacterized membrane protein YjgN (DUF898 family)
MSTNSPALVLERGSNAPMRANFTGTGGEMFGQLFVGLLLTGLTLGIYQPWFTVRLQRYLYSKITFGRTARGNLRFEFTGAGGELFTIGLVGMVLTVITLGIYGPWFYCNLIRFFTDHSAAIAEDGTRYQLKFDGTGGPMFVTLFVGQLLTMVTLGIYLPWFLCKLERAIYSQTRIFENGQSAGGLDFLGTGGALFGQYLIGLILTGLTLGIYLAWFEVRLEKFMLENTRVRIHERTFAGGYDGTGGQLFAKLFVGGLLTGLTLGIYYFWFLASLVHYQLSHIVVREV